MKRTINAKVKAISIMLFSFSFLLPFVTNAQWSEVGGNNTTTFSSGIIHSITLDGSNNVYVAGNFTNSNGKNYVAKWNGSNWVELGGINTSIFNGIILITTYDGIGNIYCAGNFTNANGKNYVAKWNGSNWSELGGSNNSTFNGQISSITTDSNGNLYAAGQFTNSNIKYYVAEWNGSNWVELGGINKSTFNGNINSITTDKNGYIYASGEFYNANGKYYVAKWNGSNWSELGGLNTSTLNNWINSITTDKSGDLYAAGWFTNTNGKYYVAKWNGSNWSELGGNNTSTFYGFTGIYNINTDEIGNLYAGGDFTNANGKYYLAKWNGSSWFEIGGTNTSTFNSYINSVATDGIGNLYAAGWFGNSIGNPYVAKYTGAFTPTYIWTGTTSIDWNIATNWSVGLVPTSTSSIIIPTAPTNQPILRTDVVVNNIEIDGNVTINGKSLTLNGAVTGTGSLKGSAISSVIIGGTVGTIRFDANNNSLQNLTINGTSTLGNALNLYGKLTVNTGGTLTTGGNLTLKSVSTGTAVVEQVNGNISGTVKVERYIPQGYSAHRDLGVCVSGAGAITNTWGDSLKNYLVYNYNSASGWTTIPNSSSLNKYIGYRVLISGHNNPIVPTTYISYMNSDVTLAYSGTLLTGNQSIPLTTGSDKFSFVSNPYASQVDFNALTKSGLYDGYWYLDPTTMYGTYENYNYYGSNIGVSNVFAKSAAQYLQSGQGFFVCSNSTTPSLTFTESAKNNNNSQVSIFGATTPLNRIATGLFTNGKNLDGAVVVFNNNFTNGISKEDGLKINNQGENLTFSVAGKELCANGWSMPSITDELLIHLYQLNKSTAYSLRLDASQFIGNGLNAYLKDNLLNTQTLLKGDSNMISFATTTDTFSNRFSVVFKPTILPVKSISATATLLKGNQVDIKWKVVGETNVVSYQVERSSDGINFTSIITTAPNSNNNYSYIDATEISNPNYYRIKAIDNVGGACFSNIASVDLNNHQLSIIPNPIVNKSFKIGLTAVGKYSISLVNKYGQIVYSKQLNHSVASTLEKIVIGKSLATGSYTITATDESGKAISTEVIIQ